MDLSAIGADGRGDLVASATRGEERCRSILVELLTPLIGFEAEGQVERLLAVHADAAGVVASAAGPLRRTAGADPRVVAHLAVVKTLLDRCLWLRSKGRAATHPRMEDYLQSQIGHERTEQVRVVFVDTRCRVIGDETMWRGTVDRAPLYVREIISKALAFEASGFVVVHNHPSGDVRPSDGDLKATGDLARACATMGLKLHDHLIVSAGDRFSMRRAGLLS